MNSIRVALFAILACSVSATNADEESWQKPIAKVIGLLRDMETQLNKEAKEDEEMYEKMGCWCITNDKEKTKAIADANRHIEQLTAAIEGGTSKVSQLETDLDKLAKDIAKQTDVLSQATAIRTKENGEFQTDQADMSASQASLAGAVVAMKKSHGAALSQESLVQVKAVLKHHMEKHRKMFHESRSPVISLLQESYTPASGAIFGILKQMKEEFESNIASSSDEEAQALGEYNGMKKAKTDQINAAEDLSSSKTVELGDTKAKLADDKQDLKDTTAQLEADTKFLASVKDSCATADADYDARSKVRGEEIQAVGETIGILTSDDAQSSFSKSSAFIQLSLRTRRTSSTEMKREKAARILKAAAMKSGDRMLAKLSSKMKLLDFSEIKKAIDDQVAELKKTQQAEAEEYEFCTSELKANVKETAAKNDAKADLEQKIADLEAEIATLTEDIAALTKEVAETQVEMADASTLRESENKDFQVTVADQKATQAILKKAMERMKAFYASFAQTNQTPPKQGTHSKNGGGNMVVMLLEAVINESKDVESKALKAENDAQKTYEEYIADSNAAIQAANDNIMSKSSSKAKADKGKIAATTDRDDTIQNLLMLGEHNVALHQDCDFLVKNFEVRQQNRAEEVESLNNAKAIFSGANFGFLQQHQF